MLTDRSIEDKPSRHWSPLALAAAIFSALSLAAAIASPGFLEADACTHYMYSRFCLSEWHLMTNVWGRPFCTMIYAIPAVLGGRLGVRIFSLLMALAIAFLTRSIARGQNYRHPDLAFIFLLTQPLVFLHSFSELTELPFALLMALAFLAYQRKQWGWMALLVGLMPTSRPEGFGFVLIAAAGLLLHRRARWLPLLAVPVALWSFSGWLAFNAAGPWYIKWWKWLPENWPYDSTSVYDRGTPFHFVMMLPAIVSPFVFPAVCVGIGWSLSGLWHRLARNRHVARESVDVHLALCQWLIALLPLSVLAGHSFLYWRGLMASNGELRYLMVVAPLWALLAAKGWEWAFDRLQWKRPLLWAGVAALVPVLANFSYRVVPLRLDMEWQRAREVAQWYRDGDLKKDYPLLSASHTGVYYYLDLSFSNGKTTVEWSYDTVIGEYRGQKLGTPKGITLIWDEIYGQFNSDSLRTMTPEKIIAKGWVPVKVFARIKRLHQGGGMVDHLARAIQDEEVKYWIVFVSPLDANGRPTTLPPVALPSTPSPGTPGEGRGEGQKK